MNLGLLFSQTGTIARDEKGTCLAPVDVVVCLTSVPNRIPKSTQPVRICSRCAMLASMKLVLRWLLLSAALMLLAQWDSGIQIKDFGSAMIAALVLGLLNAFVRPLLILFTLPVTVLTMGLFLLVINAFTFEMASYLLDNFHVHSFTDALLGSVLYSLWGLVIDVALERLMGPRQVPTDDQWR